MTKLLNELVKEKTQGLSMRPDAALREVMQEITLCALHRTDFFKEAAFFGGTALRIFHGLPRSSEDLDFTLTDIACKKFDLKKYETDIMQEFTIYGVDIEFSVKKNSPEDSITKAVIKTTEETTKDLAGISFFNPIERATPKLRIKMDIEKDAPRGCETEILYAISPIPFPVSVCRLSSLFAGKMDAILARSWEARRVKGRDWYDLLWYMRKKTHLNVPWLGARLRQKGVIGSGEKLTSALFAVLYTDKVQNLDISKALDDVRGFLEEQNFELENWNSELFLSLKDKIIEMNVWE